MFKNRWELPVKNIFANSFVFAKCLVLISHMELSLYKYQALLNTKALQRILFSFFFDVSY